MWEAYERVKANQGAAGVDSESIEAFEQDLKNNLYQDLESHVVGDVFPAASSLGRDTEERRRREALGHSHRCGSDCSNGRQAVAGAAGGTVLPSRLLWLSASEVCARCCRQCRGSDAGVMPGSLISTSAASLIISTTSWCFARSGSTRSARGFFSTSSGGLKLPSQLEDGTLVPRTKGTPQGGVVSPLVANMFLHLAFDDWMRRMHPGVPFERYADDIVAHCATETQAQQVLESIQRRLAQCRLEVHPAKTRIVYCKDDDGRAGIPRNVSTSWGTRFALGGRRIDGENSSSTSLRR